MVWHTLTKSLLREPCRNGLSNGAIISTNAPKARTGVRFSFYTHRRLRTAALSLKRNMDVLWTFYTRPELGLPNTNNAMESFFARVKKLAGVHNGLNAEHKRTMIDAYISVYNTDKQRAQDTF